MGVVAKHFSLIEHHHASENAGVETFTLWNHSMGIHGVQEALNFFHGVIEEHGRPRPLAIAAKSEVVERTGVERGHFRFDAFHTGERAGEIGPDNTGRHIDNHFGHAGADRIGDRARNLRIPSRHKAHPGFLRAKMTVRNGRPSIKRLLGRIRHLFGRHRNGEFVRIG